MMSEDAPACALHRVKPREGTHPCKARVRWSPAKSLWFTGTLLGWIIGGSYFFSLGAIAAFLAACALTLCFGHSLGMHRKLIHQSFECPDWLEKVGVWLGTLVGLGGPFTMMRTHDIRDWAQRQPNCHPFLAHQSGMLRDAWWQLHCKLDFDVEPDFLYPARLTTSRFYRFIEATSMAQQLIPAAILFAMGGWGFVFWGICGRVTISIFGHWLVGYYAHNDGEKDWEVEGAAVQGHNVLWCGLITFGECWHNNHHAFPGAARIGLYSGQSDPGWWCLRLGEHLGVVKNLKLPEDLPARPELRQASMTVSDHSLAQAQDA